jgi:citrate lyase gamma subunit
MFFHSCPFKNRLYTIRPKVYFLIPFLFILTVQLTAQDAILCNGGNASGSGGTASFSLGQVSYTTNTGTNGSVAEGVQQAYEISVVSGTLEIKDINLSVAVYPNPTTDYLKLKIEGDVQTQYIASLYDISGKLLLTTKVTGNETQIETNQLLPATYFLKVKQGIQDVKIFKIMKK